MNNYLQKDFYAQTLSCKCHYNKNFFKDEINENDITPFYISNADYLITKLLILSISNLYFLNNSILSILSTLSILVLGFLYGIGK